MANIGKGISGAGSGAALGTAIMPGIGTVVGGIVGGIAGLFSKPKPSPQELALKKQLAELEALGIPSVEALQIAYERLSQQGMMTPEIESAMQQDATELKKIEVDPAYQDAQREALVRMQQEGREGGLTLEDRAANEEVLQAQSAKLKGQQGAILSNMAERGMGGQGQELAARLAASQGSADAARSSGLQIAGDARKRALEAVLSSGKLAGDMRSQSFGEQKDVASAQDSINKFNTANLSDVARRNIEAKNQAQKENLAAKQRIADANVGLSNAEKDNNAKLIVDNYDRARADITQRGNLATGRADAQTANETKAGNAVASNVAAAGSLIDKFKSKDVLDGIKSFF